MLIPFEKDKHLDLVADLHYKVLFWSTNSQLGRKHIYNIYAALAKLPSTFGYVWMQEEKLVGFALGSFDYKEARSAIQSVYGLKEMIQLFFYSIIKPLSFLNIIDTMFFIPAYLKKCGTRAEWLGWITDRCHSKCRVAAIQCYQALKKHYYVAGYTSFIGQFEKRSKESIAFVKNTKYVEKRGFLMNYIYILNSAERR